MPRPSSLRHALLAILNLSMFFVASTASAQTVPALIPLQGYLTNTDTDAPLTGDHDVTFALYTSDVGGTSFFEETQTLSVDQGNFTAYLGDVATLDPSAFSAMPVVYLGVAVDDGEEMAPRLEIGTAPYSAFSLTCGDASTFSGFGPTDFAAALHTHDWSDVTGVPSDLADGDDEGIEAITVGTGLSGTASGASYSLSVDTSAIQARVASACTAGNAIRAIASDGTVTCQSTTADTSTLQTRVSSSCSAGSAIRAIASDGSVTCESDDDTGTTAWLRAGNSGTSGSFMGTTDNQSLDFRVNNTRALQLSPGTDGSNSVIGGHAGNYISSGVIGATVAGGGQTSYLNRVTDNFGTIGGGRNNVAGDSDVTLTDAINSTVGGGYSNTASHEYATVAGGRSNSATASHAFVGGGYSNSAYGEYSSVVAGYSSAASGTSAVVGGGYGNGSNGTASVVAGGYVNAANGDYSTVPGGRNNLAGGAYSFAAGYNSITSQSGCFAWSDASTTTGVQCGTANMWLARASGGVYFFTDSAQTTGVGVVAGGGSWFNLSDRNAKQNFREVDEEEVLSKLVAIPMTTWQYKTEQGGARHMGPVAQDFRAAFGLGSNDRTITTVDADGVALTAIQGLHTKVERENRVLAAENALLRTEVTALRNRLDRLEERVGLASMDGERATSNLRLADMLGGSAIAALLSMALSKALRRFKREHS